ncbi:MAG: PAS domain S-box protein [Thainema sp.]
MTDVPGKVHHQTTPEFASNQTSCDSSHGDQNDSDLQSVLAALQAENQRLKAELADAHRQLSANSPASPSTLPPSTSLPSTPASLLTPQPLSTSPPSTLSSSPSLPDPASPKPLVQNLYNFLDQFTIGCAQANLGTGQYVFVNRAFCNLLGYSREQLMAMTFYDITHPDDCDRNYTIVQQHIHQPQPAYRLEKRYRHRDGHYIWVEVTVMAVQLPDGHYSPLGVVQDIRDRKQAEQQLQQQQASLQAMFEQAGVGFALVDMAGQYQKVNQKLCELTGYTEAELLQTGFQTVTHPEDLPADEALVQRMLAGEMNHFSLEKRFLRANGHSVWTRLTASLIRDKQGQPISVLGIVEDIHERIQAEAMRQAYLHDLNTWRSRYEAASQASGQILYEWDLAADVAVYGVNTERILGYLNVEMPTTFAGWLQLVHPDDRQRIRQETEQCCQQGTMLHLDYRLRHRQGYYIWVEDNCRFFTDGRGSIHRLVGAIQDISDRKQAEELLIQQAKRERALNQLVYAIRNSLNLADIFATAVREVGRFLELDWVKVVHYDSDQAVWRVVEAYQRIDSDPKSPAAVGMEIPDPYDPFAAQIKQGQLIKLDSRSPDGMALSGDLAADDFSHHSSMAQQFPGGWLIVPIRLGDSTWGSLTLMRSQMQVQWSSFDIELAQTIAAQLAIAIQQSELYQQVHQLNVTLEQQVQNRTAQLQQAMHFEALLKRITDRVRDSLNEPQILNTVVQELVHGLGALSCDSGRYDLETQTSIIAYEYVDADSTFTPLDSIVCPMASFPDVYCQLLRGQSLQICWLPERNLLRPFEQPCTALACPLIDDQGVIGDLWLYRAADDYFSEMEVRLVEQVANQCAIAVRQARLYQAAQAQVDELARLNQLKDDFLSTVSHELRTPMSSIQMAVQMLEITFEKLGLQFAPSHPISTYLQILQSECNREISLINDLLDLSRLEAEVEPLELMPIELHLWLSHIAEPFLQRTRQQQQQLLLDLPASLPTIVTDLSYLERAITELLHNACKYTSPGETIQIAAQAEATQVIIRVMNTGITIPDAERDRIFDKFYRIPNGDPWKHGGTGLGLALVKKLIERLDGTITLENPPNQAIFKIQLPFCHRHVGQESEFKILRSHG